MKLELPQVDSDIVMVLAERINEYFEQYSSCFKIDIRPCRNRKEINYRVDCDQWINGNTKYNFEIAIMNSGINVDICRYHKIPLGGWDNSSWIELDFGIVDPTHFDACLETFGDLLDLGPSAYTKALWDRSVIGHKYADAGLTRRLRLLAAF